MKKALSLLLTLSLVLGCMAIPTLAAEAGDAVTVSAFAQENHPTVQGNYLTTTLTGSATVSVGSTVTDSGSIKIFGPYGTGPITDWNKDGGTTVTSNNNKVATANYTADGKDLSVTIKGVANGIATVTVDFGSEATSDRGGYTETAYGKIVYTVTVGTGTPDPVEQDDPVYDKDGYRAIRNEDELRAIEDDMGGNYFLANDITLTSAWTPIGWGIPKDNWPTKFTGSFDGNGYTITGLTSDKDGVSTGALRWGLFAWNAGTIENLSIVTGDISATGVVGAVAGDNKGTIRNVSVTSESGALIRATSDSNGNGGVGGIAGRNLSNGLITNCCSDVAVQGYAYVGGLVGYNDRGTVEQCSSEGSVNAAYTDTVKDIANTVYDAGGLIGVNVGAVRDCFYRNTSDVVTARDYVGGIVGSTGSWSYDTTVENVWAETTVAGKWDIRIGECIGYLQSGNTNEGITSEIAGAYAVSDTKTGDQNKATYITPTALKDSDTFPEVSGWDFENVWTYDGEDGYPTLQNCGNDTTEHPREAVAAPTYTVTFEDGALADDDVTAIREAYKVTSGTEIYLPAAPTRTNGLSWVYDFQGWSDGTKTYAVGDPYTVEKDVTFTALWKLHSVDGNGQWTYLDAMAIMEHLAGTRTTPLTAEQIEAADYNGDGIVNYVDAMAIMDTLAGKTTPGT